MRKIILYAAASAVLASCAQAPENQEPVLTWEKHVMDGHLTGVTAVVGENVEPFLGKVVDGVYYAPNGKKFRGGSTPEVASRLIEVQPQMAHLKEVIGHSPRVMEKHGPNAGLGQWSAQAVMEGVEAVTGRKVDFGILNYGGIRVDMPEGDVMLDDIVSMFPFRNYLTYVALKGSDVRVIFDFMASTYMQAVSGVDVVVKDKKVESIMIGGKPLDDKAVYGLATIDFLLDGGDGLFLARNAKELIISETMVKEWLVPYVRNLTAEGREVEYTVAE